ncbi:hypothetical protein D187_009822 [Cystobacter fuscus DSM 2262]|uniref:Lipoprotein n=1 Tax=Cystobacter fuscus (strain ATCC 25194 / DSM 2262 / NBRC 100088 / M29) TaxID=1242864 RepID=S9QM12_CYSF2|nr:hypothetical protein [Cystobacter fuscus]EPX57548.1 hypothetical protein D187_009822 [Cystobacter fuscus DSM 2262]
MKWMVVVLGLAAGVWSGCGKTENEPRTVVELQPLTEPRPLRAEKATKQLGEDCRENGASACLSGLCLHVKPGRHEGYVCSQPCQGDAECPTSWRCAQVYPTPKGRLCVPSSNESGASSTTH